MKALTETYRYKYKKALAKAKYHGLVLVSQGLRGSDRFVLKIRVVDDVLERFDDIDEALGLIEKHKHTGGIYKDFLDKLREYNDQVALVKYSFDDVILTWTNNKWFVKHKGSTAQPMGTKRLAELGYLQHIVENNVKGVVESKTIEVDLKAEGYKPIPDVKKGYYINKHGDIIRETSAGFKFCNIRREFRAMSDDKKYVNIDVDKEVNKLFWS